MRTASQNRRMLYIDHVWESSTGFHRRYSDVVPETRATCEVGRMVRNEWYYEHGTCIIRLSIGLSYADALSYS